MLLAGLSEQGIFIFDEARSLVEARELVWNAQRALRGEFPSLRVVVPPPPPAPSFVIGEMSKPLMLLLHAFADTPAVALRIQVLFGLATLVLLMDLARLVGSRPDRIVSALVLWAGLFFATSPGHTYFSRTLFPDVEALFFFLLALRLHGHASIDARRYALGLVCGVGFLCHPRFVFYLPVLFLADYASLKRIPALLQAAAGFCSPLILTEVVSVLMKHGVEAGGDPWSFGTYSERLLYYFDLAQGGLAFSRPFFGIEYLGHVEGWGLWALFLVGFVYLVSSRDRVGRLWAVAAAYFVILGSLYEQDFLPGERLGRMVYPAIPFMALTAGVGAQVLSRRRLTMPLLAILLVSVAWQRAPVLGEIVSMRSDQQEVFEAARGATGARRFLSDQPYHGILYAGHDHYAFLAQPRADTIAVVVFDRKRIGRLRFGALLPEEPQFLVRRSHRPSRLQEFEEFTGDFIASDSSGVLPPAAVYLLPPTDSQPTIRWF